MNDTFLTALEPRITEFLTLFVSAVFTLIGFYATRAMAAVREKYGTEAERILREELAKAMQRALSKAATDVNPVAVPQAAADYLIATMPDTVKRLGASREGLTRRAEAELATRPKVSTPDLPVPNAAVAK
ncbi:MAG: hypothetical protein GW948_02115 [Rhodobacterales bacterium]|nr:hypothetical protein [Rhodobacterales bacterium]